MIPVRPTIGAGYPEVEFTKSTYGDNDLPTERLGIADSKRFYDKWKAFINPNSIVLETIKLMRYMYALGYYMARIDYKNNRGFVQLEMKSIPSPDPEKRYTAKQVQSAYMEGVSRGLITYTNILEEASQTVVNVYTGFLDDMRKTATNPEELANLADKVAKECDCPKCHGKNSDLSSDDDISSVIFDIFGAINRNGPMKL